MQVMFFNMAFPRAVLCWRFQSSSIMVEACSNSQRNRETDMTDKDRASHSGKEADAEKRKLDDALDEALRETFPASDPVKLTQPYPHAEPKKH
jgi:hypothetical protein